MKEQDVRACHWRQLYRYRDFYRTYQQIVGALTPKKFAELLSVAGNEHLQKLGAPDPKIDFAA